MTTSTLIANRQARRRAITFAILIAVTLLLMAFSGNPIVREVQRGLQFALAPIQDGIATMADGVADVGSAIGEIDRLRSENNNLRDENERLANENSRLPRSSRRTTP